VYVGKSKEKIFASTPIFEISIIFWYNDPKIVGKDQKDGLKKVNKQHACLGQN
jgi:hypothetical protein